MKVCLHGMMRNSARGKGGLAMLMELCDNLKELRDDPGKHADFFALYLFPDDADYQKRATKAAKPVPAATPLTKGVTMGIMDVLDEFHQELTRAERKFPGWPTDIVHAAAVLQEEAGELGQAALQITYDGADITRARCEAVQVGAMALRFLLNLDSYLCRPSTQIERVSAAPNKPSTPCYNEQCPALWRDHVCTSTKWAECSARREGT